MKYVLIVPDGMADLPHEDLDGKTAMMAAKKPEMDDLAFNGIVGTVLTVPPEIYPSSDAANMAILGNDPRMYLCGRGPLEAAAMGAPMSFQDAAFRCSLISTDGEKIIDHSSGNISDEDARVLISLVEEKLSTSTIHFYPGVGYRHIMIWQNGPIEAHCTPPHDVIGQLIKDNLPKGDGEQVLRTMIDDSMNLLFDHPINRSRMDEGLAPANTIWPWGQGRPPKLPDFLQRWGISGGVVAAVDLIKGLGKLSGLETLDIQGATGYLNTNYSAKGAAGLEMLEKHDFVFIHIEAPDEAGHQGDLEAKIFSIEQIDKLIVGPVVRGLKEHDFRILILPDHKTPVGLRKHDIGHVPFLFYDSKRKETSMMKFDESALEESKLRVDEGWKLIDLLLK